MIVPDDSHCKFFNEHKVEFKNKDEYIIPCVKHYFNEKDIVKSVGMGPIIDEEKKKIKMKILKEKLMAKGYSKAEVFSSELPVKY